MESNKRAVLRTLIYSYLFSTPLTLSEVRYFLESAKPVSMQRCRETLGLLTPLVSELHGYYFLSGQAYSVAKRKRAESITKRKRVLARNIARSLAWIPTIRFIGLSGSVAAGTAEESDDIDFFIITKKNTLFLSRLLVLLLLDLSGRRRRRVTRESRDAVCVNFLLDETKLAFPKKRQELYTARELAQLLPLFDRKQTYHRLLTANPWLQLILPHVHSRRVGCTEAEQSLASRIGECLLSFPLWEYLVRRLQLFLIMRHRTRETVSAHTLAFHPYDYRGRILKKFQQETTFYEAEYAKKHDAYEPYYIDKARNTFYTA
jgi:hypothetical protein